MADVFVRARARRDILSNAEYLEEHGGVETAQRFLDATQSTFEALIGERVRILPVEQRFLVYYCNTLIREIDPATSSSAIIDRYVAAPHPCP